MKEKLDIRKSVGSWLRELRRQKGLTQEEVAEKAGVSVKYYSELERGLRNITLGNLQRVLIGMRVRKEEVLRLLISENLSEDDKAIINLAIRILSSGTSKTKIQTRKILEALAD
jgi:transcriptional regulator with XRE-family HTH domain